MRNKTIAIVCRDSTSEVREMLARHSNLHYTHNGLTHTLRQIEPKWNLCITYLFFDEFNISHTQCFSYSEILNFAGWDRNGDLYLTALDNLSPEHTIKLRKKNAIGIS